MWKTRVRVGGRVKARAKVRVRVLARCEDRSPPRGHKAHQDFGQSGAEQPCLTGARGCRGRHPGPASLGQPASRAALLLAGHSRLAFHIGEQLRSVEAQLGRRAAAPGAPPPARSPYMRQARQAGPPAARLAERQHRAHLCGRQRRRGSGQFPLQRQVNQAQGGV